MRILERWYREREGEGQCAGPGWDAARLAMDDNGAYHWLLSGGCSCFSPFEEEDEITEAEYKAAIVGMEPY